jgi:hypothetical protein
VPWDDVFDKSLDLDGDTMTFEVEFDQDQLSDAGNYDSDSDDVGAGTSSPMPDDEDENDEAFGEVRVNTYKWCWSTDEIIGVHRSSQPSGCFFRRHPFRLGGHGLQCQ